MFTNEEETMSADNNPSKGEVIFWTIFVVAVIFSIFWMKQDKCILLFAFPVVRIVFGWIYGETAQELKKMEEETSSSQQ